MYASRKREKAAENSFLRIYSNTDRSLWHFCIQNGKGISANHSNMYASLTQNEVNEMAAKIITIAIEKGGTGKTVTASNLAYLMGEDGKRVLCIDTDPQGNLTSALSDGQGESAGGMYDGKALYDMFTGFRYTNTKDYITETEYGDNVQMIPASSQTPRINQRMPELFEDATIIAKKDSSKQIASIAEFLYYFLSQVRD